MHVHIYFQYAIFSYAVFAKKWALSDDAYHTVKYLGLEAALDYFLFSFSCMKFELRLSFFAQEKKKKCSLLRFISVVIPTSLRGDKI